MAAAWTLVSASHKEVFLFTAIFLMGSIGLVLIVMLANPGRWPLWAMAALTALLAVTIATAGWVWRHPDQDEETPPD